MSDVQSQRDILLRLSGTLLEAHTLVLQLALPSDWMPGEQEQSGADRAGESLHLPPPAARVNDHFSRDGENDEISHFLPVDTPLYTDDQVRTVIFEDRRQRPCCHVVGWAHEDELPKDYPYDAMHEHSRVDGVRMFPVFAPATAKESVTVQSTDHSAQAFDMVDERAAFEAHWYGRYHAGSIPAGPDGSYFNPEVQRAWDAWQARAALTRGGA